MTLRTLIESLFSRSGVAGGRSPPRAPGRRATVGCVFIAGTSAAGCCRSAAGTMRTERGISKEDIFRWPILIRRPK